MIDLDLDATDEAALLKLSSKSSLKAVQATLEEIARRRGVDWRKWIDWKPSVGWPTILPWLALQHESQAYESLIAFAFERFWPGVSDPKLIPKFFERFGQSLHALGQFVSMADDDDLTAALAAEERAKEAVACLLISAGPSGARIAFSALDAVMSGKQEKWLAHGWGKAQSKFGAASMAQTIKVPSTSGRGGTTL